MTLELLEILLAVAVVLLALVGLELGAIHNNQKNHLLIVKKIYERLEYLELDSYRYRDDIDDMKHNLRLQVGNLHAIHGAVEKMERRTRPNYDWEKDPDQRSPFQ
jgi:hypothetical protein